MPVLILQRRLTSMRMGRPTALLMLLAGLELLPAATRAGEAFPLSWEGKSRPGVAPKSVIETTCGLLITANTRWTSDSVTLVCYRSTDGGQSWATGGLIASDPSRSTDLGDSALVALSSGEVFICYRHNRYRRLPLEKHEYSIRVASSRDGGLSWRAHSTVDSAAGTSAGLWASYLLETSQGEFQCYYDDEVTPSREGFHRHQWLTMRAWDPEVEAWVRPTTVSRARDSRHLSRDGMCTVLETSPGRLLCVFESVDVKAPHRGVLRRVTSADFGRTWSWKTEDRPIVWRPQDPNFNVIAPWTIRLASGAILSVFVTDEDRAVPDTVSTGRLDQDVKAVYSSDDGVTWSERPQMVAPEHPCYLPGVVQITTGPLSGSVLLQYTSHNKPKLRRAFPGSSAGDP